jgi:hypothetical protein
LELCSDFFFIELLFNSFTNESKESKFVVSIVDLISKKGIPIAAKKCYKVENTRARARARTCARFVWMV